MMNEKRRELQDLRTRTKRYALRIIRVCSSLPAQSAGDVIGRQLLKAGTSVGAHYREAIRGRSTAEFISKIEGGLQELEESRYWMELLGESGIMQPKRLCDLDGEANELTAIMVACVKNAKKRRGRTDGRRKEEG
jgi:four helix bundle protein